MASAPAANGRPAISQPAAGAVAIGIWMPGRKPRQAEGAAAGTAVQQGDAVTSGGALDG